MKQFGWNGSEYKKSKKAERRVYPRGLGVQKAMRYREIPYQEKESKMNKGAVHQKRRNEIARQAGRPKKKQNIQKS